MHLAAARTQHLKSQTRPLRGTASASRHGTVFDPPLVFYARNFQFRPRRSQALRMTQRQPRMLRPQQHTEQGRRSCPTGATSRAKTCVARAKKMKEKTLSKKANRPFCPFLSQSFSLGWRGRQVRERARLAPLPASCLPSLPSVCLQCCLLVVVSRQRAFA